MPKRILVALSGSPFTSSAIRHAVQLGVAHDAHVTGVTVSDLERLEDIGPVPIGAAAVATELARHRVATAREAMEASVEEFTDAVARAGVSSTLDMEKGNSLDRFRSLSRYADITIVGLRGLFEYGVVRNPKDTVLRAIADGLRPMLAVANQYREIRRVMVAYNGSMEAAEAMRAFSVIDCWTNVDVRVICLGAIDGAAQLVLDAESYIEAHGYDVDTEVRPGNPHSELLTAADEWNADLIVMGTTSRGKLRRLIWGDTALEILEHSTIPVFMSQ